MDVQYWATTDQGQSREHNEDNFLVDRRLKLFIVCDGMGGHAAGEVASALAVRVIRDVIANNRAILARCEEDLEREEHRRAVLRLLEYAVQEACTKIFDMAQNNPDQRGMGTTCSLLLVLGHRGFIAHVGDSRVYRHRRGQTDQITEDHSLENEMRRRGRLGNGEQVNAAFKNAITRAVGIHESVEVDTYEVHMEVGDRYLLCSDGLSMYLDDQSIAQFLGVQNEGNVTQHEAKRITEDLIQFANSRGGKDNITALLIAANHSNATATQDDVRLTMDTVRNIPLFHYLNYKELAKVINLTHHRQVEDGEHVIQEGTQGEELFIVLKGSFLVERAGQRLATLKAGRHFGEMALVDDCPRSASVRALEHGTLLVIRRSEFYDFMRTDPNVAVKLLWNFVQTLSARLRDVPVKFAQQEIPFAAPTSEATPTAKDVMTRPQPAGLSGEFVTPSPLKGPKIPTQGAQLPSNAAMHRAIGEDITLPGGIRPSDYGIPQTQTDDAPKDAGRKRFPPFRFQKDKT